MTKQDIRKLNQPSHLKDLMLLFAVPIVITVIAVIAVYVPRLLANPKYDFVYLVCVSYRCDSGLNVDSSGYIAEYDANIDQKNTEYTLRYYDASDDSTRGITLEEAKGYRLDASSKSPDGYSLGQEERDRGFLFWGDNDSAWYLKNGAKKKKVELSNESYYLREIKLLGWIKDEK